MNYSTKKKKIYLILTILSAVLSMAGMIFIIMTPLGQFQFLYIFIVLIVGLLLMNKFRYQLDQEIYLEQHFLLLKSKSSPYVISDALFTDKWIQSFVQKGFRLYKDYNDVSYYYRIDQVSSKHRHGKTLVLLILIHNPELKFDNNILVQHINALEDSIRKKERYRQRVFIHFKSFNQEDDTIYKATEKVFWIRKSTENIVSVNVSFFEKEKTVYYLHNSNYTPNQYYKYAIDMIQLVLPKQK